MLYLVRVAAALTAWGVLSAAMCHAADCQSLAGRRFNQARIIATDEMTSPFKAANIATPKGVLVKSAFCRVRGVIEPAADSEIQFEVWLPGPAAWNGRYQGVGNGGFAGAVIYQAMNWALEGGYAVAGSDTGHTGAMDDSSWALGHPEKVEDLGWRAIHETAVASKAIVAAYYGKPAAHSYFNGCSTGGRQGLVEAQRFPTDYDGIVVGAPANYWPRLLASDLQTVQAAAEKAGGWVSREKLAAVSKAALNTCHASDGVIDNPGSCKFDPASLLGKSGESQSCLTQSELATLREIYAGLFDSAGNSIYPGFPPGTEASWSQAKMGPAQGRFAEASTYPFPTGFFGNLVFGNAAWNFRGVSPLDALNKAVNSPAGRAVYADNPDLAAFRAAGGKLIQYHGWSDPAIPAGASIKYYESVAAQMSGVGSIRAFYRLFLAPGMGHCGGGAGPNAVGAAFGLPPSNRDPAHDVVSAVARWVEDGVAPETITATLYRDNDPAQGIAAQRPWCVYPATARLEGQGDRREANSYECQPPH